MNYLTRIYVNPSHSLHEVVTEEDPEMNILVPNRRFLERTKVMKDKYNIDFFCDHGGVPDAYPTVAYI